MNDKQDENPAGKIPPEEPSESMSLPEDELPQELSTQLMNIFTKHFMPIIRDQSEAIERLTTHVGELTDHVEELTALNRKIAAETKDIADSNKKLIAEISDKQETISKMTAEIRQMHKAFTGRVSEIMSEMPGTLEAFPKIKDLLSKTEATIRRLENMAYVDRLTGLSNRQYLDVLFERERGNFVGMVVDIDHFKAINDTHGHAVGDKVLAGVAKTIRETAKTLGEKRNVYTIRPGGEEFFVLVGVRARPGTNMDDEVNFVLDGFANNIRKAVEAANYGGVKCTVTIGVSPEVIALPNKDMLNNSKGFKIFGDDYLYAAKKSGRNKVGTNRTNLIRNLVIIQGRTQKEAALANIIKNGSPEPGKESERP